MTSRVRTAMSGKDKVLEYLEKNVIDVTFLKARHIKDELKLGSRNIGGVLSDLGTTSKKFRIEKWTNGKHQHTWKITRISRGES